MVVPEARNRAAREAGPRRRDPATTHGAPYRAFGPAPAASTVAVSSRHRPGAAPRYRLGWHAAPQLGVAGLRGAQFPGRAFGAEPAPPPPGPPARAPRPGRA